MAKIPPISMKVYALEWDPYGLGHYTPLSYFRKKEDAEEHCRKYEEKNNYYPSWFISEVTISIK